MAVVVLLLLAAVVTLAACNVSARNRHRRAARALYDEGKLSPADYARLTGEQLPPRQNGAPPSGPQPVTLPLGMRQAPPAAAVPMQASPTGPAAGGWPAAAAGMPTTSYVNQPTPAPLTGGAGYQQAGGFAAQQRPVPPPVRQRQLSAVNVALGLGVAFVFVAALVFVATNWWRMDDWVRLLVLLAASGLSFAGSFLAGRSKTLKNTGAGFYILGGLLAFCTVLAAGAFDLLPGFSLLYGEGALVFAVGFFVLAAVSALGLRLYGRGVYLFFCLLAAEAAALCLAAHVTHSAAWQAASVLAGATVALLALYLRPLPLLQHLAKTAAWLAQINFYTVGGLALLLLALWGGPAAVVGSVCAALGLAGVWLLKHADFARYLLPVAAAVFCESVAGVFAAGANRALLNCILFCAAFFTFRVLRFGGKRAYTWAAFVCFGAGGLAGACYLASMEAVWQAPVAVVLLAAMLLAAALGHAGGAEATAAAWACVLLPFLFHASLPGVAGALTHRAYLDRNWAGLMTYTVLLFLLFDAALASLLAAGGRRRGKAVHFGRRMELPCAVALFAYGCYFPLSLLVRGRGEFDIASLVSAGMLAVYTCLAALLPRAGMKGRLAAVGNSALVAALFTVCAYVASCRAVAVFLPGAQWESFRLVFAAGLPACMLAASLLRRRLKHPEGAMSQAVWLTSAVLSQGALLVVAALFCLWPAGEAAAAAALLALAAVGYSALWVRKKSMLAPVFSAAVFPLVQRVFVGSADPRVYWGAALWCFLAFCAGSRLLERKLWDVSLISSNPATNREHVLRLDWLHLCALAVPVFWLSRGDDYMQWGGVLLLAVWQALFLRRLPGRYADRIVMTVLLFTLLAAFDAQPFIEWPQLFSAEILAAPFLACGFLLRFAVWKDVRKWWVKWLPFGFVAFTMLGQITEVLKHFYITNTISLGVAALAAVAAACVVRRRRWFALGAGVLLFMLFYFTRAFWASLAWWVYLLAAGIVLISLAALNEGMRHKGDNLKTRFFSLSFFSAWQW